MQQHNGEVTPPHPQCLCDSCKMTVEQCRGKQSEVREEVLDELYGRLINSRETVGRYVVVTIADIECIFAELRLQQGEREQHG